MDVFVVGHREVYRGVYIYIYTSYSVVLGVHQTRPPAAWQLLVILAVRVIYSIECPCGRPAPPLKSFARKAELVIVASCCSNVLTICEQVGDGFHVFPVRYRFIA